MSISPPSPYPNVESDPPHVCWGIWKERKNRVFKNEEISEEIVKGLIFKLIVENMQNCQWRKLLVPPTMTKQRISRYWNLDEGFMEVGNSKQLARIRTRWSPPKESWVKLNFDGAVRREGLTGGGMVREHNGRMLMLVI